MNKKILVAAIGAALSVGMAAAQAAEVKISGYANISVDVIEGASAQSTTENKQTSQVSSNSSNIVISASEDLGNGLKGVFSLQEFYRMDNTGSRNSGGNAYVGLQGGFGLIKAGSHDTPAKLVGRSVDLFGNQIGDSRNMGVNNTRAQNVVAYVSPNMGGFSFALAHATNLDNDTNNGNDTRANAVLLKYEGGPVSVGVGIDDANSADGSNPRTTVIGGSFGPFGGVKINALYQTVDTDTADTSTMGAGVAWKFGDNTLKAQYYTFESDDTPAADNATMLAIGFDHAFSKAFTGYIAYATTDNEAAASRSMSGGGHGDDVGSIAGEDPNGVSVGMVFKF